MLGRRGRRGTEGEEEEEDEGGGRRLSLSLLDPAQRLDLESLSVGAPLSVVFVLAAMAITLHDVLVTTVSRVLVANPAEGGGN